MGARSDLLFVSTCCALAVSGCGDIVLEEPALSIDATSAAFGEVIVGESATRTFVVTNTGDEPTGALTVAVSDDASGFRISASTCTNELGPDATCEITIAFAPGRIGVQAATLGVAGAPGGSLEAALEGEGLASMLVVLSRSTLEESWATGTVVGSLAATDRDGAPVDATFALAAEDGCDGTDNASFTLAGATLSSAAVLDHEARPRRSICVVATDELGRTAPTPLTIAVADRQEVATGFVHTCTVRDDRTLWCWGTNDDGQLGAGGGAGIHPEPVRVGTKTTWASVAVGSEHTCAIELDGSLWCWGRNTGGQLGVGTSGPVGESTPRQVDAGSRWAQVTAGAVHTCAIKADRSLWCWGSALTGNLGNGATTGTLTSPARVGVETAWEEVTTNNVHTCAIKTDGSLWCWGFGDNGRLGVGSTTLQSTPVQVAAGARWATISAGWNHTCATKVDGSLWCWGAGGFGQLGIASSLVDRAEPVQVGTDLTWNRVHAGGGHTCATQQDRSLWCWGIDASGQLGNGPAGSQDAPARVDPSVAWASASTGANQTCATGTDGTLWCWGADHGGLLGNGTRSVSEHAPVLIFRWASLAAGDAHTCGIRTDRTLWCWGRDNEGQLGNGAASSADSPAPGRAGTDADWRSVTAGNEHTCAIKTDGSLWCWGADGDGQLGDDPQAARQHAPVRVGAETTWVQVDAGWLHTCAIKADGSLWCWGANDRGQLGHGATGADVLQPVQVGSDTRWRSVEAAGTHTCATQIDDTLWCWGSNQGGALGLGNLVDEPSPRQVAGAVWAKVSASFYTTCATRTDGTLWCWGDGVTAPAQIGTTTSWSTPARGYVVRCATRTDHSLWCWGADTYGQLGNGLPLETQSAPIQVDAGRRWSSLIAGAFHACAIQTNGALRCWGRNNYGQLGNGLIADSTPAPVELADP